jgi:hypothetical protein
MSDDPKWRELPILRELHSQWLVNRGNISQDGFQRPFSRDWETLLIDAELFSAESRNEAARDARILAVAGLLAIKSVRYRPEYIQRVSVPLEAEVRLRNLFPEFYAEADEKFDLTTVLWEPEMKFVVETRAMVNPADLLRLNAFLKSREQHHSVIPIKERSLQIFGDEKRLDLLLDSALFRSDRLSLELLKCEIVGEPFGWKRGPADTGKIIIIENAATWHSYSRWNASVGQFSAVVYGRGNCFAENVQRLKDTLVEFSSPQRILYFGDLDPQGLRIPVQASAKGAQIGLSRVEPDLWSYERLLEIGRGKEVPSDVTEPASQAEFEWLSQLAEPARAILDSGKRLAQEHVGWEFLSTQKVYNAAQMQNNSNT